MKPTPRLILILGFTGMLLLMGFAGWDSVVATRQVQANNSRVRQDFLTRTRTLEQIRSNLYLSGTYVRDYLLEPDPAKADTHRRTLQQTRTEMDVAIDHYRSLLNPEEVGPFDTLTRALQQYWKLLEPIIQWDPVERRNHGYTFVRDEVFPRRMAILQIADQIASINEKQWAAGRARVDQAYADVRQRIIITITLTVGLGTVLAVFSARKILQLERETAARYAEIRNLSARLVEIQENERRAISRELHDEVGQSLSGVLVEMANLSKMVPDGDANTKLAEIKTHVEHSIGAVRDMALLLRPSMLDDLGLIPALQWQAREVSKRSSMRVKLAADDMPEDLPEDHKTAIYRIVQEALHNAVRHSGAQNARVTVQRSDSGIQLTIQDDGNGFNPIRDRGMGMLGMQERVTNLHGAFHIDSAPGSGTTIKIQLPLAPQTA